MVRCVRAVRLTGAPHRPHGVLSAGVNLAPAAWQRITASSLGMDGNGRTYPDQQKGIWDLGRYLEGLRDLYGEQPSRVIAHALARVGLLEGEPIAPPEDTPGDPVRGILDLMVRHGDA